MVLGDVGCMSMEGSWLLAHALIDSSNIDLGAFIALGPRTEPINQSAVQVPLLLMLEG
jgi:hypothetical protein